MNCGIEGWRGREQNVAIAPAARARATLSTYREHFVAIVERRTEIATKRTLPPLTFA
jgi:hypothetical protein